MLDYFLPLKQIKLLMLITRLVVAAGVLGVGRLGGAPLCCQRFP